jgi:hypothetical protein
MNFIPIWSHVCVCVCVRARARSSSTTFDPLTEEADARPCEIRASGMSEFWSLESLDSYDRGAPSRMSGKSLRVVTKTLQSHLPDSDDEIIVCKGPH